MRFWASALIWGSRISGDYGRFPNVGETEKSESLTQNPIENQHKFGRSQAEIETIVTLWTYFGEENQADFETGDGNNFATNKRKAFLQVPFEFPAPQISMLKTYFDGLQKRSFVQK